MNPEKLNSRIKNSNGKSGVANKRGKYSYSFYEPASTTLSYQ